MREPLISIIVPAFNAAPWIEETLRSCEAQTYRSFEVIVVDDASTDDTAAIADRFAVQAGPHVKVVRSPHVGAGAARNIGLQHSRGELLYFLDADDLVEPDALRAAVALMQTAQADAVVGDWIDFVDGPVQTAEPPRRITYPFAYPDDPTASVIRNPVVICAVLFPRSAVRWDEQLMPWEGQRFIVDVFPGLSRIVRLPEPMARIRQRRDPERLTIKHDHFAPLKTLAFNLDLKTRLAARGQLTDKREEAIDWQVLSYCYAARQQGHRELSAQCASIRADRLHSYTWHKPLGLSGFAATFGVRRGLELFYLLNRVLGRTQG